jgi:hypothetical protein
MKFLILFALSFVAEMIGYYMGEIHYLGHLFGH